MKLEMYKHAYQGKTLADLFLAITQDYSLGQQQKDQLISQLKGVTNNAHPGSPLSALMYMGLGGLISNLIGKYFGMGRTGRTISTIAGLGIGKVLYNQLNKPKKSIGYTYF